MICVHRTTGKNGVIKRRPIPRSGCKRSDDEHDILFQVICYLLHMLIIYSLFIHIFYYWPISAVTPRKLGFAAANWADNLSVLSALISISGLIHFNRNCNNMSIIMIVNNILYCMICKWNYFSKIFHLKKPKRRFLRCGCLTLTVSSKINTIRSLIKICPKRLVPHLGYFIFRKWSHMSVTQMQYLSISPRLYSQLKVDRVPKSLAVT